MAAIIFWTLACGIAGGTRNFLIDLKDAGGCKAHLISFFLRLVEGVLAAATVPLFLSLIGNDIVSTILNPPSTGTGQAEYAVLKFIGFCLIAAIFSKSYLEGLSTKVMDLQKDVAANKKATEKLSNTVDAAVVEDGIPTPIRGVALAATTAPLAQNERAVLEAFRDGKFPIRSISGLVLSTSLSESDILAALESLEKRALARSVDTQHGKRWSATPAGYAAVKA
jgi:hypothetical protein